MNEQHLESNHIKPDSSEEEIHTFVIKKNTINDTWGFHLKGTPQQNTFNQEACFTINRVKPEGQAFGILEPGDKLVYLNEVRVCSTETLTKALQYIATKSELTFIIQRRKRSIFLNNYIGLNAINLKLVTKGSIPQDTFNTGFDYGKENFAAGIDASSTPKKPPSRNIPSLRSVSSVNYNNDNQSLSDDRLPDGRSTLRSFESFNKRLYLNPEFTKRQCSLQNISDRIGSSKSSESKYFVEQTPKPEQTTLQRLRQKFDQHSFRFHFSKKKQKTNESCSSIEHINPASKVDHTKDNNRDRIYNIISNEQGYMGIISKLKERKNIRETGSPSGSVNEVNNHYDSSLPSLTPNTATQSSVPCPTEPSTIDHFESRYEHVGLILNNDMVKQLSYLKFSNVLLVHEDNKKLNIKKDDILKKVNGVPISMTTIKNNFDIEEFVQDKNKVTLEIWRRSRRNSRRKNKINKENEISDGKSYGSSYKGNPPQDTAIHRRLLSRYYYSQDEKQTTSIYKPTTTNTFPSSNLRPKRKIFSCQSMKTHANTKFNDRIDSKYLSYCSSECVDDGIKSKPKRFATIRPSKDGSIIGVRLGGGNIHGIFLVDVKPDSRAGRAGLQVGYKIISVNSISFEDVTLEDATLTLLNIPNNQDAEVEYIDMTKEYECMSNVDGDELYVRSRIDIQPCDNKLETLFLRVSKDDVLHITCTVYKGKVGLYFCEKLDSLTLAIKAIGFIPSSREIIEIYNNKTSNIRQLKNIRISSHTDTASLCHPYERLDWIKATFLRPVIIHSNFDGNFLEDILISNCGDNFKPFPLIVRSQSSAIEYLATQNQRLLSVSNLDNFVFLKPFYSVAIHLFIDFSKECCQLLKRKYCLVDNKIDEDSCVFNDFYDVNQKSTERYSNYECIVKKKTVHIGKNDITNNFWLQIILKAIKGEQNNPCLLPIATIQKYTNVKQQKMLPNDIPKKTCSSVDDNIFDLNNRSILESTEKQILMVPHGEISQHDLGIRARLEGASSSNETSCFFLQSFTYGCDKNLGLLVGPHSIIVNRTLVLGITQTHMLKGFHKIVIFSAKSLQDIPLFWNECTTIPLKKMIKDCMNIHLKFDDTKNCKATHDLQ